MSNASAGAQSAQSFDLHFLTLRTVVSPEDKEAGRKRYCGIARANRLFDLPWDENVRAYLGVDDQGRKRRSPVVNLAIRETVEKNRDLFPLLNAGLVIVARSAVANDPKKVVQLEGASIINGAQTQGVLHEFFDSHPEEEGYPSVNFELLVMSDEELIGDVSISRNFQNRVTDLSIYGRQGRFNDLEAAMRRHDPEIKLRKSETDFGDGFLDTEKLIQVVTAMTPEPVRLPSAEKRRVKTPETIYRVYAYRHRSRCLKDFATVIDNANDWPEAYKVFLDIAWYAWKLYRKLKSEQAFSPLHCVKGVDDNRGRKIVADDGVPDGIVFPMLSALSRFVSKPSRHWKFEVPKNFPWRALYNQAMMQEKQAAAHNPNMMGKNADCYVALHGAIDMFFAVTTAD